MSTRQLPKLVPQVGLATALCACLAGQAAAQLPTSCWDLDRSQPLLDRTLENERIASPTIDCRYYLVRYAVIDAPIH